MSHRSVRDRPFLPSAHRDDATVRPPGCERLDRLDSGHACKPWSCQRTVGRLVPPHHSSGRFVRRQAAFCLRASGWIAFSEFGGGSYPQRSPLREHTAASSASCSTASDDATACRKKTAKLASAWITSFISHSRLVTQVGWSLVSQSWAMLNKRVYEVDPL